VKQERLKRLMFVAGVSFSTYLIANIRELTFPTSFIKAFFASIIFTLIYAFLSSHFWKKYVLKIKDEE
jgi:peptidoglycan/LPS O-acetylase OafA/YrhL